jgi:hypothetical protein
MHGIRSFALVIGGLIGLAACAKGTDFEATFTPGSGGAGGFDDAGGKESVATTSSHAATSSGSSTSGAGSTGTGGDSSTSSAGSGGSGGAGGDSSSSSSSSSGTGGGLCNYGASNTCIGAETLSAVDGDENNDTRTVKDSTSKWLKVLVSEGVSSLISYPQLSYTATLNSPPGMDFDLFEYDGSISTPSCSGNPKHASGTPEAVTDTWGDTVGTDDTRWLTLEVRYVSGEMCPSDPWTLTVKGHTHP